MRSFLINKHYWLSLSGHLALFTCFFLTYVPEKTNKVDQPLSRSAMLITTKQADFFLYHDVYGLGREAKSGWVLRQKHFLPKHNPHLSLQNNHPSRQPVANTTQDKNIEATTNQAKEALLALLHQAIANHQIYPASALLLNQTGLVHIGFFLHQDGSLSQISLLKSSGVASLDKAATEAVAASSPIEESKAYLKSKTYFTIDVIFT